MPTKPSLERACRNIETSPVPLMGVPKCGRRTVVDAAIPTSVRRRCRRRRRRRRPRRLSFSFPSLPSRRPRRLWHGHSRRPIAPLPPPTTTTTATGTGTETGMWTTTLTRLLRRRLRHRRRCRQPLALYNIQRISKLDLPSVVVRTHDDLDHHIYAWWR